MNRFATLLAAAAVCTFAAHAQAGVNAVDVPHISNGSTGFIGLTESAPRTNRMGAAPDAAMAMRPAMPATSQEARPDEPRAETLRTRGDAAAPSHPLMHPTWGTPD